jgi:hypothetical protein
VSPAKSKSITWVEFLLVCFMVFSATFNNITEDPKKTTDLSQVTDKRYYIMLHTSFWSRFKFTNSVVMGTDCIGSCKSNNNTIMATTTPSSLLKLPFRETYLSKSFVCTCYVFSVKNYANQGKLIMFKHEKQLCMIMISIKYFFVIYIFP